MTWEAVIETVQKFWLQFFLTGMSGAIVMLWRKINESRKEQKKIAQDQKKENEIIKNAVKAILLDRCYQGSEFFLEKGFINDSSLKVLLRMFDSYLALGDGDPAINAIIEDVKRLPKQIHRND